MTRQPIPRIARVEILYSENDAIPRGSFRSLAGADLAVAHALRQSPPVSDGYEKTGFRIVWTDGVAITLRADVNAGLVAASAGSGVLRQAALQHARYLQSDLAKKIAKATGVPDIDRDAGLELAERIAREAVPFGVPRNAATGEPRPTLLPDPVAAVAAMRERFARERGTVQPTGKWADRSIPAKVRILPHPATTADDLRQAINTISIALSHDLGRFPRDVAVPIWNYWRSVVDGAEILLHVPAPRGHYIDNEGFWTRQLPGLAVRLAAALVPRNAGPGGLTFRPVGNTGEPYPQWLRDLQDQAGVYVLRERQADGTAPIVYVGMSSGKLYDTITRHLQTWRRAESKGWVGKYTARDHDPGLTYQRGRIEVAVLLTAPADARDTELALIAELAPRDNIDGAVVSDAGLYDEPWPGDDEDVAGVATGDEEAPF